MMTHMTSRDLGMAYRRRREAMGLTQAQLGKLAGYKAGPGAAVSISRFENGHLTPTPEKLAGIERALGFPEQVPTSSEVVFKEEFVQGIQRETDSAGDRLSAKERRARIDREINALIRDITDLERTFAEALDAANADFLMRLIEIAARVHGLPKSDLAQFPDDAIPSGDDVAAEAAYSIRFTMYGVAQALAGTSNAAPAPVGVDAAAAYPDFTAAVARWTASAGAAIPLLEGAAPTAGFLAALRVGTPAAAHGANAGLAWLDNPLAHEAAAAVGELVLTAERMLTPERSRKHQRITAWLDSAEAAIAATQPNVEALQRLLSAATEILKYIAVHAGHALNRWEAQVGQEPCDWPTLSEAESQRYVDFVEIAAAQLTVATIDFESLIAQRGPELVRSTALVSEIVAQARKVVTSHV